MPQQPSQEEAALSVTTLEEQLSRLLRSVHPEELVRQLAIHMRAAAAGPHVSLLHPPHLAIHLIEACCAYWQQHHYRPLDGAMIDQGLRLLSEFPDPVLSHTLRQGPDLFDFQLYVHRTQLDKQRELWWMPVGRTTRLFGEADCVPQTDWLFKQRYGLNIREWVKLAFAVHAATQAQSLMTHQYAQQLVELNLPRDSVQAFLKATSSTPRQIGDRYNQIRSACPGDRCTSPLTWMHRKPQLADTPLIRLVRGYVAPVEAYMADLFGNTLFRRITQATVSLDGTETTLCDAARQEVGNRLEVYARDAVKYHLPQCQVWTSRDLASAGSGRSCDLAVDLPDSTLLIECKAVTLDTDVVTSKAVLGSNAIRRIVEGYEQIIETAGRIASGSYQRLGINIKKPRYGIVVTLGEIPGAGHPTVWQHAQTVLRSRNRDVASVLRALDHVPQAFDGFALEHLLLLLRSNQATVPALFTEHRSQPQPLAVRDWSVKLARKCVESGKHDLSFWSQPGETMLEELGVA